MSSVADFPMVLPQGTKMPGGVMVPVSGENPSGQKDLECPSRIKRALTSDRSSCRRQKRERQRQRRVHLSQFVASSERWASAWCRSTKTDRFTA